MKHQLDPRRILDLMSEIETLTGKMFHETYPDLEESCIRALDRETKASFVINRLTKLIDELRGIQ